MSENNQLVDQNPNHKDPYRAKASDFSVKSVKAANGQSGGAHGESEGQNMLVKQSEGQVSPRDLESEGHDGPSAWGKGGKAFSVSVSSEGSTSLDNPCGVDLATGEQTCKGYKKTKVSEVIDPKVSIG